MAAFIHKIRKRYFDDDYRPANILNDLLAGLIVGLISIPISMGYAQVAGIPMVYGLYGSLFPILAYGLLSSTRNFVFGVDAAPAALVGGTLLSLGIANDSYTAMQVVPMMAVIVGIWLLMFHLFKVGRIVKYISTPVMGGFVTGICCTVIMMQLPKLYGGTSGMGEAFHLILHMVEEGKSFHLLSLVLGLGTIAILLISKRYIPKLPMPIVMMVVGIILTKRFHVDELGVKLLPHVDSGLPKIVIPNVSGAMIAQLIMPSLIIAVVILAETLLASKGVALKDGHSINSNREVLAYAIGNLLSAMVGCLPVNGSVSRTGLARQYGARSHIISVTAACTMVLVLIYGTGYIEYMPVPVLTAIVISALIGACEFDLFARLWKSSRIEAYIFLSAFFGVLILGTIYGVIIGMLLSFIMVIIRAVIPPRAFLGVIPGKPGFYDMKRYRNAYPVKGTVIYRFSGNLFFANIDTFQDDIEQMIREDTKQVIINAAGISQIDVTAAERLKQLTGNLEKRGITLYLTEHLGAINDQLRQYDVEELLWGGNVRRTMELALRDCELVSPYPLDIEYGEAETEGAEVRHTDAVPTDDEHGEAGKPEAVYVEENYRDDTELEWIFGAGVEGFKERMTREIIGKLKELPEGSTIDVKTLIKAEAETDFGRMGLLDEDDMIQRIEAALADMNVEDEEKRRTLEDALEERKEQIEEQLIRMRISHIQYVESKDPKLAKKLKKRYGIE